MEYIMTKKGRKPENKPTNGIINKDSFSEKTTLPKNRIDITITNRILGINDEIVSPYNDETNQCFLFGLISSKVILRTMIAITSPAEKDQNNTLTAFLSNEEANNCVISCNHRNDKISTNRIAKHSSKIVNME
ncbi:hypothetical protein GCM10022257_20520 [Hyunsoonleella aestuarii]|uniref:Uncharacterized protein n=1 Tax=Hyunsoonleella aestuarii TaxID=912802 RepID=A0ABP8ECW1_9FLAO